jgi:hypothetical protein
MSAGWVGGSVRARTLARRRLDAGAARQLATSGSLRDAQQVLGETAYARRIHPGQDLAGTQHSVASALLWDLRVLAGWLPQGGVRLLRVLAAWFEIANVDEMLQALGGRPAGPEFQLGALATAWPRLRKATSRSGLRAALTASDWRDPGGDSDRAVRLGMRVRYASRAAALGGTVGDWAVGAMALLVAGELGACGHAGGHVADGTVLGEAASLLGPAAMSAQTLAELADRLPSSARWALEGISAPDGLWRALATWRAKVEQDGLRLLRTASLDSQVVLGAVAVMACDAWRIQAALEIAARGGRPIEAYDELA